MYQTINQTFVSNGYLRSYYPVPLLPFAWKEPLTNNFRLLLSKQVPGKLLIWQKKWRKCCVFLTIFFIFSLFCHNNVFIYRTKCIWLCRIEICFYFLSQKREIIIEWYQIWSSKGIFFISIFFKMFLYQKRKEK